MSVFGSRDEDPLLQNDPLSPSDEEEAQGDTSKEASTGDAEASEDAFREGETAQTTDAQTTDEDGHHPSGADEDTDPSVFHASTPSEKKARSDALREDSKDDTCVIVRAADDAADGQLRELRAAFASGWSLGRVVLQGKNEDLNASLPLGALQFAFVLEREVPDEGEERENEV